MISPFKIYFDQVLDRCEFDVETRKGMLFFLATSMITNNVNELMNLHEDQDELNKAFNDLLFLYAVPDDKDQKLFDMNFQPLLDILYSVNYIYLEKTNGKEGFLNQNLKPENQYQLIEDLVEQFADKKYTIATNHQLMTKMFRSFGAYLHLSNFDEETCYKAGLAFYKSSEQKDFEGFNAMISTVTNSFSPLYRTLFKFPLFFVYDQNRLNANHLFSSILQFLYFDVNRDIARNIHAFHNYLFLKPNSVALRDEWKFEEVDRGRMISQMMFNALNIRNSPVFNLRNEFLNSDQFILKGMKNQTLSQEEFIYQIQHLMEEFYEMKVDDMVEEEYNHAEYLQFLAIIFYEASAHAMLPNDLTQNK